MIKRESYLKSLRQLKDINLIKVVTGIRRSGKSTLLQQFRQELLEQGVSPQNIISINLEDQQYSKYLQDGKALHDDILAKCDPHTTNYIFLDEIQMVPDFERILDSLFVRNHLDLYVTGSNAYMTSSELATLLSGRYIEIKMQPLVFSEFVQFFPDRTDYTTLFTQFMRYGGFPEVANMLAGGAEEQIPNYLRDIYTTVLEKDIKINKKIRNLEDFRNVLAFAFDNIGSITSPSSIANTLTGSGHVVDNETVDNYLTVMADCYVLYQARRFDIRGKKLLRTLEKYYVSDLGLANTVLGKASRRDLGHQLENIVYLELLHRYSGQIWIGKNYDKEIDFVVKNQNGLAEYFQVAQTLADSITLERETTALENTGDHYKKTILTLDILGSNEGGIKTINVIDWLLHKNPQ